MHWWNVGVSRETQQDSRFCSTHIYLQKTAPLRFTIQGGATYTDVIQHLDKRGALRNLPSCPQFTVAGAIATATHGSGVTIPNLAADVSMLEFVVADGSLVRYTWKRFEFIWAVWE